MPNIVKQNINNLLLNVNDYIFNNLLAINTLIGIIGWVVQVWFPKHLADWTTFASTFLIHQKKVQNDNP